MANQYGFMANNKPAAAPKTRDLNGGFNMSNDSAGGYKAPTQAAGAGYNIGDRQVGDRTDRQSYTTGGYRGSAGQASPQSDSVSASSQTTPSSNGWQQGPTLTMQQQQPQYSGYQPQNSDFQNSDGSWHNNPSYGGQGGGGGGGRPQPSSQTSGEDGRAPGNTGWSPQNGAPDFSSWQPGTNLSQYEDEGYRKRIGAMSSTLMPWAQFEQNNYQYGNDFAENVRRDDRNYGLTADQQHYQQGLSDRQQSAAEQQAALAGNQWALSYQQGLSNDKWSQGFQDKGQNIQNQQFQQNFGLQDYATREQLAQSQWGDQQKYGQSQQQINNQNTQFGQTFGETQRSNDRNYGLQVSDQDLRQLQNSQQYEQGNTQLGIQDFTAKQNAAYQTGQLAQQGQLGNRGLDIQDYQAKQQVAYQQQQLAQTKESAYLSAYGRNQAPNAKWRFAT